jgi:hypothetical protein
MPRERRRKCLARGPDVDAATATDLATAIDGFITGPYATLRTVYSGRRERTQAVGDLLAGVARAVPVLAITGAVADRLQAIDARMQEIDASMTSLGRLGPTGLDGRRAAAVTTTSLPLWGSSAVDPLVSHA